MPCRWCGKSYEEHRVQAHPRFQPRMPCLGLRSGYLERRAAASEDDEGARAAHKAAPVFDAQPEPPDEPA